MLNKFSEKMKKGIGTVSLAFFLCSSMSFVHINWAEAAPPPPPPNQTEKKTGAAEKTGAEAECKQTETTCS